MLDFNNRIANCEEILQYEGSEMGDAISSLISAANTLIGIGYDKEAETSLSIAEQICKDYCEWCEENPEYDSNPPSELITYFMERGQ